MVLATQGWRRFAEQIPPGYIRRPTAPTRGVEELAVVKRPVFGLDRSDRDSRTAEAVRDLLAAIRGGQVGPRRGASALAAAYADRSAEDRAAALADEVEIAHAESRGSPRAGGCRGPTVERFRKAGWYGVAGFGLLALLARRIPVSSGRISFAARRGNGRGRWAWSRSWSSHWVRRTDPGRECSDGQGRGGPIVRQERPVRRDNRGRGDAQ